MRARTTSFKSYTASYAVLALILAIIGFIIALLNDRFDLMPDRHSALSSQAMIIGGLFLFVLGGIGAHLRFRRELQAARAALEEKADELAEEKVLHRKTAAELQDLLGGLGHRKIDPILLSTVIEQTEDNVLITDNHRTILYINPAFEQSCGYTCEELKGKPLRYLRSDQHDNTFFQTMKEVLDSGEVWVGVIINRGKDGIDFEIEGTISPIRDELATITYWVAVGRNMSRFRKLERELQRVQKMDALGTLAGGIAHDFNNILTAIMGLVELEQMQAEAGSQTHGRMGQALSACGRARNLVRQILTFSSRGEQRRKPLCIFPVIVESLQMLRATIPTTISIKTEFEATTVMILGDATPDSADLRQSVHQCGARHAPVGRNFGD